MSAADEDALSVMHTIAAGAGAMMNKAVNSSDWIQVGIGSPPVKCAGIGLQYVSVAGVTCIGSNVYCAMHHNGATLLCCVVFSGDPTNIR